jgi:hypothetical protein
MRPGRNGADDARGVLSRLIDQSVAAASDHSFAVIVRCREEAALRRVAAGLR